MSQIIKIQNPVIKFTIQAALAMTCLLSGAFLFYFSYFGPWVYSTQWDKRLIVTASFAVLSTSYLFIMTTWRKRLFAFFTMFAGLTIFMWVLGGMFGFFDAQLKGDRVQFANDIWIAYDAGDFSLGINFKLIADAISTLLPWVFLSISMVQLIYAEEASEYIKAVIEGVMGLGFMYLFAAWIYPWFV